MYAVMQFCSWVPEHNSLFSTHSISIVNCSSTVPVFSIPGLRQWIGDSMTRNRSYLHCYYCDKHHFLSWPNLNLFVLTFQAEFNLPLKMKARLHGSVAQSVCRRASTRYVRGRISDPKLFFFKFGTHVSGIHSRVEGVKINTLTFLLV